MGTGENGRISCPKTRHSRINETAGAFLLSPISTMAVLCFYVLGAGAGSWLIPFVRYTQLSDECLSIQTIRY